MYYRNRITSAVHVPGNSWYARRKNNISDTKPHLPVIYTTLQSDLRF